MVNNIDKFNAAIEHFRKNGHAWPRAGIQSIMLTGLANADYLKFEKWLFETQAIYDGNYTMRERT